MPHGRSSGLRLGPNVYKGRGYVNKAPTRVLSPRRGRAQAGRARRWGLLATTYGRTAWNQVRPDAILPRFSSTQCPRPSRSDARPPEDDLSGDASPHGGEPLVPILRLDDGGDDADALANPAPGVSNALSWGRAARPGRRSVSISRRGGPVLLGPEALAEDDLKVPDTQPVILPQQAEVPGIDRPRRRLRVHTVGFRPVRAARCRHDAGREPRAGTVSRPRAHRAPACRPAPGAFARTARPAPARSRPRSESPSSSTR